MVFHPFLLFTYNKTCFYHLRWRRRLYQTQQRSKFIAILAPLSFMPAGSNARKYLPTYTNQIRPHFLSLLSPVYAEPMSWWTTPKSRAKYAKQPTMNRGVRRDRWCRNWHTPPSPTNTFPRWCRCCGNGCYRTIKPTGGGRTRYVGVHSGVIARLGIAPKDDWDEVKKRGRMAKQTSVFHSTFNI